MLAVTLLLFSWAVPTVAYFPSLHDPRIFKIFGGSAAHDEQFPFMASLLYSKKVGASSMCGGTLLSTRFVLTAAHCVVDFRTGKVMVDSTTLGGGQWSSVRRIVVHPRYSGSPDFYNDIAIIEIDPVQLNDQVKAIRIVKDDSELLRSQKATVIGFGTYKVTEGKEIVSSYLRHTNVRLFSASECRQKNGAYINESLLCAGDMGKGTGSGDSGGPLLVSTRDGLVQVGVTSHGSDDFYKMMNEQHKHPDVYVRVSKYCGWIAKTTKGEVNCE
uniref:Peptidase S1 domain-containing protein n=1 Tax=Steinernema glaseri TaxID=37863 RepID=A0A1I7Y616_9BILA